MGELAASRIRQIESLVTEWVHAETVPGVSIVVVDSSGELYAEGFGARDIETNAPATPDSLCGMGSVSKSFTALAVVQLAEAGVLSLDDEVDDYVDHLADVPGDPVTVAELLSHTSGMPEVGGPLAQYLTGVPAGIADEADAKRLLRENADRRLIDEERFLYFNAGYGVLGSVVEAVDGRPFAEYVEEAILEPLGMNRSGFGRAVVEDAEDAMTPYMPGEDAPEAVGLPVDELLYPAGGLVSSPREMGRFVRAMMTDGAVDGGRVCEPEVVERLQRGRVVAGSKVDGRDSQYGYGWMRSPVEGDELVGHGGSVIASTAYAGFLEDAGLGVVLACNTAAAPGPKAVASAILAVAAGREPTTEPAYALREKARAVTGTYTTYGGDVTADVERDGGEVTMALSSLLGEEELALFPATVDPDDHEYYTVDGSGSRHPVEFDLGGDTADLIWRRYRLQRTHDGR